MEQMISNTSLEQRALSVPANLADGHPRAVLTDPMRFILDSLGSSFERAMNTTQTDVEDDFLAAYQRLAGECFPRRPLFSYSVSALVATLAPYLRLQEITVFMAEPAFDNIRDLLISATVPVVPFAETELEQLMANAHSVKHAIWLTSPANPTGHTLDESAVRWIAKCCADRGALLVIDHCFRFFAQPAARFALYAVLEAVPGLDYLVLEDTGKTVPFLEIKASMMCCAERLLPELTRLNQEMLLNVSPCLLGVLARALDHLADGALGGWLLPTVSSNRRLVCETLAPFERHLLPWSLSDNAPFLWYRAVDPRGGIALAAAARELGLHVLPGNRFFSDPRSPGSAFVRIALARPHAVVARAMPALTAAARRTFSDMGRRAGPTSHE